MPVPDSVTELVQRFTDSRAQYRQTQYNEMQTRIDFVNPFFAALGWDMDNAAGLPEAYRQVVHEDALKIERTVKAPDYSFRLGGQRKYFLETKKPSVVIGLSRESAYQLRRYAWTANLPVCNFTHPQLTASSIATSLALFGHGAARLCLQSVYLRFASGVQSHHRAGLLHVPNRVALLRGTQAGRGCVARVQGHRR